jgi:hypothetical protein
LEEWNDGILGKNLNTGMLDKSFFSVLNPPFHCSIIPVLAPISMDYEKPNDQTDD